MAYDGSVPNVTESKTQVLASIRANCDDLDGRITDLSDGSSTLTQINVDNVRIDGNTISSTDTNGDLLLVPDGSGQVGVNVAAPFGTLHTQTASSGASAAASNADDIVVENDDNGGISILTPNNKIGHILFGNQVNNNIAGITYNHSSAFLNFVTAANNQIYIDANGDFVPVTTESQDLGGAANEWDNLYVQNSPTVSDERRKENIKPIENANDFLKKLEPVEFTYKETIIPPVPAVVAEKGQMLKDNIIAEGGEIIEEAKPEKRIAHKRPHTGFIAQKVKEAMNECGIGDWGGYAYDNVADLHQVRLNEFIAVIVAGYKELEKRVSELEKN